MSPKAITFNEKVIALIKMHELSSFSVVQIRDIYLKSEPKISANRAYKSIYKSIWLMHKQGIFGKAKIEGDKTFTYSLSPNFKNFLEKNSQMAKHQYVSTLPQVSDTCLIDTFIQQMIAELSILENEMLAKKAEAQEYQRFISKLPNHKDMLLIKFNEANTAVVKLLGRITAAQRVLSEFR